MLVSDTALNGALDTHFNNGSRTYSLKLKYDGGGESSALTVDFTTASAGSISLSATVYFAVLSGITVTGIRVYDDLSDMYIDENVTPKTYAASGTYTVSGLTLTLSA